MDWKIYTCDCLNNYLTTLELEELDDFLNSQVHNLQKLKNISLKELTFLATKTKVTCLRETVFFHLHILELLQFSRPCG